MEEDSQGYMRICETLGKDLRDFGRGFTETLGEDLQGFMRIHETLGEDSQGFTRLWERFCETLGEDSRDFGRGFMILWERFHKDS